MLEHGDDAGHCSNGLTAERFREATAEERTTYRRWMRGAIALYGVLLLFGALAWINHAGTDTTQLTSLTPHRTAVPSGVH